MFPKQFENLDDQDPKRYFSDVLLAWYEKNRRNFPWRTTSSPYKIAVAEALLQKTSARNVLPIYGAFLKRFPRVQDLAWAETDFIVEMLKPLGLPARAQRLHQLAVDITMSYGGNFPRSTKELRKLPGIGPYGAAAIMCQAFGERTPMIDVNTMRIFQRVFSISVNMRSAPNKRLQALVLSYMPDRRCKDYNLALLDLGALLCHASNPQCDLCPLAKLCDFQLENP